MTCGNCKSDNENYCPNQIDTYGATYPDGVISQGGFSSHIRVHEYFVFPIPDSIDSKVAAPMMCAGLTVYSPLVRLGCGPGKKVAICGMGGLGHFAVQFAKALGADVTVLSHTANKEQDAKKMGADNFVNTTEKEWYKPYDFTFDFILNCADVIEGFDLPSFFSTLKVHGKFHCVGLSGTPLPELTAGSFARNGNYIGTSHIGSRPEALAMLELASKSNVTTWLQTVPISEKGCAEAVQAISDNTVRYRYVLTDFDKQFGKRD